MSCRLSAVAVWQRDPLACGGPEVVEETVNIKKPAHPAMKKPVSRATLLEDLLSDFLEVEDMLLKLELKDGPRLP